MTDLVLDKKLRRIKAMHWWIKLHQTKKITLAKRYFLGTNYFMLKGKQIEFMWLGEKEEKN